MGVAATDSNDIKWDGSNYGSWVALSAPGVAIYNATLVVIMQDLPGLPAPHLLYQELPALVASHNPTFSTGAIMNMIVNNTESIDSLNPTYAGKLGSGRLNAYLAIIGNQMPKLIVLGDTIRNQSGKIDSIPEVGDTVNLVLVLEK